MNHYLDIDLLIYDIKEPISHTQQMIFARMIEAGCKRVNASSKTIIFAIPFTSCTLLRDGGKDSRLYTINDASFRMVVDSTNTIQEVTML